MSEQKNPSAAGSQPSGNPSGTDVLPVTYVPDARVTPSLDRALISLLSACFTKPGDEVFRERRYFHELPQHRFLIPTNPGASLDDVALAAHLAIHDRAVSTTVGVLSCGGIAEVAVSPEYRRQGLVRRLLDEAHTWLSQQRYEFAILFGDPGVYGSKGYRAAQNPVYYRDAETGVCRCRQFGTSPESEAFMYRSISGSVWPSGPIDLQGYKF